MSALASNILAAVIFGVIGVALFGAAFVLVDKLTPGRLWDLLCHERGTPLAIFLGAVMLGLAIIIAAAIH